MFARNAASLILAAASLAAAAEPPREGVESANGLLRQGKTADALQAYRNLQIDDPESELLYYNIGCAQLESADAPQVAEDPVAAVEALNEARAAFDKASMAQRPEIRRDARFNRVNCDSRLAKQLAASGDHQAAVEAFENAVFGYEDFLDQYPGHAGAQKNLAHMRYLLKRMLQNPPEQDQQPDQNEEGEGENEQDQQNQEQQNQEGGEQSGEDQGDSSEQDQSDAENEEQGEGEQNRDDGEGHDQEPHDQSSSEEGAGEEQQSPGNEQAESDSPSDQEPVELPNKETIEAILDALAERDNQEQHNMRRVPQDPRRSGPWW